MYIITYQVGNMYRSIIGDRNSIEYIKNSNAILLNVEPYEIKEVSYGK